MRRFLAALNGGAPTAAASPAIPTSPRIATDEDGSNAWALAPSRTKSGKAILLRNPHLAWTAGYYEAHLTVPGVVDFYGDFRIGGPLIVIGGFNRDLGWATTNSNSGDLTEIYALDVDPQAPDRYLLDGASLPLTREIVHGRRSRTATRCRRRRASSGRRRSARSSIGPRTGSTSPGPPGDGEFRAGEQFLRMMRARSLAEWKDAMRMRALVTSNYTYADRAGNIFYLWNTALPLLPHPPGGDAATPVREMRDLWTRYVPFDALPQLLQSAAAATCTTRTTRRTSPTCASRSTPSNAYPNIEPPMLRLRSQHAIELIDNNRKLSLEDVVRLKHSYRMLLADRVKPDLIAAVQGDEARPATSPRRWRCSSAGTTRPRPTAAARRCSRSGGSATRRAGTRPSSFAQPWSAADPLKTPRGLADPARAAEAFAWAVEETTRRYGRWDVAWGDVHRVRRGDVDVPVGGCSGALGCFRVLELRARRRTASSSPTPATAGCSRSSSATRRARIRCSRTARARDPSRRGTPIRPRCSRAAR